MSTLGAAAAAERLAAGELVLVGDEADDAVFVAAAADRITVDGLSELQDLGRGPVLLGMAEATVERLRLHGPTGRPAGEPLRIGVPIDAAGHDGGGWSLSDRAHTMRVAAGAQSRPQDLLVPGHVLTARIEEHGCGAAAAALELARVAGSTPTVALSAVLDNRGAVARLGDALRASRMRRIAHVSGAELRSLAVARGAGQLAADCELPTREGHFRAIAFGPREGAPVTVALVHGDPSKDPQPFVHVHVACRLGDVFGSRLCGCRAELDAATDRILAEGCGVIIYAPPPDATQLTCAHDLPVDAGLVSGLLRAAGVQALGPALAALERARPDHKLEAAA